MKPIQIFSCFPGGEAQAASLICPSVAAADDGVPNRNEDIKRLFCREPFGALFLKSLACVHRAVPKLPRKPRVVELRGRRVFGVPLLASVQQTGEPLPPGILRALLHLRAQCLDQVGSRLAGQSARRQGSPEPLSSLPGGPLQEVRGEVSYPVPARAGGVGPQRRLLRGALGLRRSRHGEAVFQRPAGAHFHQQTLRHLSAHLPV